MNKANRNIIYNTDKHRVKNDQVNDKIVNNENNNVEIAKDFTIDEIPENIVDSGEITGFTAGLITRDLVSKGEEIIKQKHGNNNR